MVHPSDAMKRCPQLTLIALLLTAVGLLAAGCNQPSSSTPDTVDSVSLYQPDSVPAETLYVLAGSTLQVTWPVTNLPAAAELVYRNRSAEVDTSVPADVTTGSLAWTLPDVLETEVDYDLRIYNTNGTEVLLQSAVFNVLIDEDASTNGASDANTCGTDADCSDGAFCNGIETCSNGLCVAGEAPCSVDQLCDEDADACVDRTCETSADCFTGEVCHDGVCVADDGQDNDLAAYVFDPETSELIDLTGSIAVGRVLLLDVLADTSTTGAVGPAATCTCTWTVDPAVSGTFDDAAVCQTTFTPTTIGDATLIVARQCGDELAVLRQSLTAAACTLDEDCGVDGQCLEGVCAPPGPSIEVLQETPRTPYVVRLDMRLKDADDEVIAAGVTSDNFRVYENDVAIDLTETNQFVTAAPNLPLRVILVLDYTRSMQEADAIDAMIEAAQNFITAAHFTATHEIGVIEFHDRGDEDDGFSTVAPLTVADATGRLALAAALPAPESLESGLSRVWDAVDLAVTTLTAEEAQIGEFRAIVFLTDGRDTTSEADVDSITTAAVDGGIRLYPIGFGDVADTAETLAALASDTSGRYFSASAASSLSDVFMQIALDLRGQWNLTYITTRNTGLVDLRVAFDWNGQTATYTTSFDANQIAGDVNTGLISVLDRAYDPSSDYTSFLMKAEYMPRGINALNFNFAHSDAVFLPQGDGGLIDPDLWKTTSAGEGVYFLTAGSPLEFGAFGNIGVALIPGDVPALQVTHNDAIYASFVQPKSIAFEGDLWAEPYTLTVDVEPDGYGAVAIVPEKAGYGHGEFVALTAVPIDTVFDAWTGDATASTTTVYVVMDDDKTVTANFTEDPGPP